MARQTETCASRHLKLVALILGAIVTICGGTLAWSFSTANSLDVRIRRVEQNDARNTATLEAIKDSVGRIERKLENRHE